MEFRKTRVEEVGAVVEVLQEAKLFLRKHGVDQWQNGYPNSNVIIEDINAGVSYVCVEDTVVLGTVMLSFAEDLTYAKIYEGQWQTSGKYAVIHRLAVCQVARGTDVAINLLRFCESECLKKKAESIKIDTHEYNLVMQRFLLREGFVYCGVIYLLDGSKRFAYEKKVTIF